MVALERREERERERVGVFRGLGWVRLDEGRVRCLVRVVRLLW